MNGGTAAGRSDLVRLAAVSRRFRDPADPRASARRRHDRCCFSPGPRGDSLADQQRLPPGLARRRQFPFQGAKPTCSVVRMPSAPPLKAAGIEAREDRRHSDPVPQDTLCLELPSARAGFLLYGVTSMTGALGHATLAA